jgi:hypothetical protein
MTTRGLQQIIDTAQSIEIYRPRMISQMVVRSGRIRTAERTALTPFQMIVTPQAYSRWEDVRDLVEGITVVDRNLNSWVKLSNTTGMNYITEYRGELTSTQVNTLRVATTGTTATILGNQDFDTTSIRGFTTATNFDYLELGGIPAIGATLEDGTACTTATNIFRAGDWIQLRTLASGAVNWGLARTIPLDVPRGSGTTVKVPVNRRWVDANLVDRRGGDIYVGNEIRLRVLITRMPAFKLLPGKIVEWTSDFELLEDIT